MFKRISISASLFLAAAAPAFAHINPEEHGSFMAGVSHPLFGLDHILVMVAAGLWAARIGGRALWIVPSAFAGTMVTGYALALSGIGLPFVEPAILASVIALGLLVAMAVRLPVSASAAIAGVFALFHGHAHGGELGSAGALQFGIGFVIATALLHVAGIGLGIAAGRFAHGGIVSRIAGALTALAGTALVFA